MAQFIGKKAPILLAGASVGLVSHMTHQHKDGGIGGGDAGGKDRASTPRAAKQYGLVSPRGIFAIASPAPAQCEGGSRPVFVSTSRKGDRAAVAAESEARLRAKNMLRDVVSMWETSTDSDTHPW
jgi:hypothetical protein